MSFIPKILQKCLRFKLFSIVLACIKLINKNASYSAVILNTYMANEENT